MASTKKTMTEIRAERTAEAKALVAAQLLSMQTKQLRMHVMSKTGCTHAAVNDMIRAARKKANLYRKQPKFVVALPA